MLRNKIVCKSAAVFFLFQILFQTFLPTLSYALTSGPSQPEFSSFEPVATTHMVDEFTGDLTYNLPILEVPGPHGSSYPLSLSYHSGATPEEEASWVGYGWTLNAGAINRATRGLPDDYKGKNVTFHNTAPTNWTATVGGSLSLEAFGFDVPVTGSASLRYNNYRGFGYNAGLGISLGKGLISMGYNVSDGTGSFSSTVNPYAILSWNFGKHKNVTLNRERFVEMAAEKHSTKLGSLYSRTKRKSISSSVSLAGSTYGVFSYTETVKPNIVQTFNGTAFNFSLGLQGNPFPVPVGGTGNLFGSYAYQNNKGDEIVPAYGFLYSSDAAAGNANLLMDYHVEQERDFNPRDNYLGIPFNDADNFMVTGEGVGGGFRLYNKSAGHFGPRATANHTDIYNVGGEVALGWTFGPGADLGVGSNDLSVADWKKDISTFQSSSNASVDEPIFFRFNNDMGGEWGNAHDDQPFQATFDGSRLPTIPAAKTQYNSNNARGGRSSFIGYHTNGQIAINSAEAFSKIAEVEVLANRGATRDLTRDDLIGEFSVVNESGVQYNYGLPVYAKEEVSINYSTSGLTVSNNLLAYTATPASQPSTNVQIGEEKLSEYASTYLLTEILTADYLDKMGTASTVGEPGSSPDDLGGYTRFNYSKKMTGSSTEWYYWRAPYRGLSYNRNSHSDPLDDIAGYSAGKKQTYLLHSIETKSHVALFNTTPRLDSREAVTGRFDNNASYGSRQMESLSDISLYSISDFQRDSYGDLKRDAEGTPVLNTSPAPKPIKVVHFDYDYSTSSGVPNSTGSGKLTLTRVYFEYNGVSKARISPYVFKYAYPAYSNYPTKYNTVGSAEDVTSGFKDLATVDQNPVYNEFQADSWGFYQVNGQTNFAHDRQWVNQSQLGNQNHFDPAAWQLKVIQLPSGGEIHVQYEQDDYNYVQNQAAHVMAPLSSSQGDVTFNVDLTSIGIPANSSSIADAVKMFNDRYGPGKNKVYFKIRYSLVGGVTFGLGAPLSECNADYITGYASVSSCTAATNGMIITLDPASMGGRLPKDVCLDFVKAQRLGKIVPGSNCDPSTGVSQPDSPGAIVNQLASLLGSLTVLNTNLCLSIDYAHSYFRIPTPLPKLGGGLRVKRLMMYDGGLGNPVLYGSEYIYKTKENGRLISSGVATNEPRGSREENILVDFVARKGQSVWSKIVAGKDRDQAEGPLGESVLPGPSVGYSKVTVKNIHSGKSNPGFSISEFYTAKDYPIQLARPDVGASMTGILRSDDAPEVIPAPYYSKVKNKTRATQGFSFVLNNMHGQAKSTAAYSGPYSDVYDLAQSVRVSSTSYEYYSPGEKLPVMSSLFGGVTMKNPGREVDITFAQRQVLEKSNDVNVEVDGQLTIIPLLFIVLVIPYPTAIPSFSYVDGEMDTHATSKVVRYPAVLKRVQVYQDGITHTQENLAFDEYTGKPVAVRSSDEFKGAFMSQTIPASWIYPNYTSKAIAQGKIIVPNTQISQQFNFQSTSSTQGTLSFSGDACTVMGQLVTGDVVQLNGQYLYFVDKIDYNHDLVNLIRADNQTGNATQVNAVRIVTSGRNNKLTDNAGSITFHNPTSSALSPTIMQVPDANRYVTSGNGADDGSAFVRDLNSAYAAYNASSTVPVLTGPYNHMNVAQYVDHTTATCTADLSDATIRNVKLIFINDTGNLKVRMGSFEVDCGGGNWFEVNSNN